ncbi:MAG: ATP-binding protein [Caldilineaceae bacterium]|nr:ATP-binding protein [Caldilineaceae bacterium]
MADTTILPFTAEQLRDPLFFFSEDERQLLRRCATLRAVDADVYEAVIRPDLPSVDRSFVDLAEESYTERIPGAVTRFSLRDPLRSRAFQSWWTDGAQSKARNIADIPDPLRAFSARLVDYYAAHNQPLDRLYHLVAADRAAAAQEFQTQFAEADAILDLPFCTALLHLFEEREDLLGPHVVLLNDARRRLRARTLWAREQYETAYYLERTSTRSLLEDLLGDAERRILQIYAPGGMGKTMFLRATIARRCVPRDIPCARIDFDLEPKDVAHSAWRLCLRMAQQLSQQLPRNPFEELLAQYERHMTPQRLRVDINAPAPAAIDQELPRRVVNSFLEKVAEIDRPFLVIFDTMENLRGHEADEIALYDLIERLHGNLKARIILAGRFDLRQPIEGSPANAETEFSRRLGQSSVAVHFRGFSDEEARIYLTRHRKLQESDDEDKLRILALLDKARTPEDGINPFTLALLADVVRANPRITAAEIAAYPDANLAYLIERVIDRIEDKSVRWVVRYGVAPRRLTRSYVERVLLPVFEEVESHPGQLDDAQKDRGVPENAFGAYAQGGNVDHLWQTLYRYVSDYSWVMTASDTPDALIFHASVLDPMRTLLWEQLEEGRPVLRLLHEQSLIFYTELAQEDTAQAGRWLREAFYHNVQTGAADVDEFWFAQVAAFPEQAVILADEALALAAAAARSADLRARSAAIAPRVQATAAYLLADNLVHTSLLLDPVEQDRLAGWLSIIERNNPTEKSAVPAARIAYLRARLQHAYKEHDSALSTVGAALPLAEDALTSIDLHMLHGELLREDQPLAALSDFETAFHLADSDAPARLPAAGLPLATLLQILHREPEALTIYERLFVHTQASRENDLAVESLVAQVRLLTKLGQERKAAKRADGNDEAIGRVDTWIAALPDYQRAWLRCEGALATCESDLAWRALEAFNRTARDPSQLPPRWFAVDADLRARMAALHADLRTAYSRYQQINSEFVAPADQAAHNLLTCAELAMGEGGDLNLANNFLSQSASYSVQPETDLRRRLLAARLQIRKGDHEEARAALQTHWDEMSPSASVFLRLPLAVELLTVGGDAETLVRQISQDLALIEPVSRRPLLLSGLTRCPLLPLSPATVEALLRVLPTADDDGQDPALSALRMAEVYRVCGRWAEAQDRLQAAISASGERLAILRRIFLAHDRLEWTSQLLGWASDLLLGREEQAVSDLIGLATLEQAERLYRHFPTESAGARQLLEFSGKVLGHPSSVWTARIMALEARLALADGDRSTAEANADAANKAFLSLGDERSAATLSAEMTALESASTPITKSIDLEQPPYVDLTVTLSERSADRRSPVMVAIVRAETSGQRVYEAEIVIDPPNQDAFRRAADMSYAEGFPAGFSRDWLAISAQMGEIILPQQWGLAQEWRDWPEGWLRLSTRNSQLQWLPWEMARPADTLPLTLAWDNLRFYRHIPYTTPISREQSAGVLIVRMSQIQERAVTRGSRNLLGIDIANLYRQSGIPVEELQEPTSRDLTAALSSLRPSVLHLIANIREQNGALSLDVGADNFSYRQSSRAFSKASDRGFGPSSDLGLTPREIGNALRRADVVPFVILDTPAPGSVTEWVRQLCLRNAFAGEWTQGEPPAGILATGLGYEEEQRRIYEILLETLPEGISYQDLIGRIWAQAAEDRQVEDLRRSPSYRRGGSGMQLRSTYDLPPFLVYAGAALFTGDPRLRIPALAGKGRTATWNY